METLAGKFEVSIRLKSLFYSIHRLNIQVVWMSFVPWNVENWTHSDHYYKVRHFEYICEAFSGQQLVVLLQKESGVEKVNGISAIQSLWMKGFSKFAYEFPIYMEMCTNMESWAFVLMVPAPVAFVFVSALPSSLLLFFMSFLSSFLSYIKFWLCIWIEQDLRRGNFKTILAAYGKLWERKE